MKMINKVPAKLKYKVEDFIVEEIGEKWRTQISDNFQSDFPNCTEIEGDLCIDEGSGFIDNLLGLSVITSIGGELAIYHNQILTDLRGLESLTSVGGDLIIVFNESLKDLSGFNALASVEGYFWIQHNNTLDDLSALNKLTYIGLDLVIRNNSSLFSLTGLQNLSLIGRAVTIHNNNTLISLLGLDSLTSIGHSLSVFDNDSLISLSGLGALNSIGHDLYIDSNPRMLVLFGLNSLSTIEGDLSINNNNRLKNLNALNTLYTINGDLSIMNNDLLESLIGLDNIDAGSLENITVINNLTLSTCDVQSICNYLVSPIGEIEIHDNATGCNSQSEVEGACASFIENIDGNYSISISPNPFSISANFEYELKQPETVQLSVFNQLGQLIYQHSEDQARGTQQLQWKAEGQPDGLYFYRLQVGDAVANGKLVKVR